MVVEGSNRICRISQSGLRGHRLLDRVVCGVCRLIASSCPRRHFTLQLKSLAIEIRSQMD